MWPPLNFEPAVPRMEGRAFGVSFRLLTWGLVLALLVWMMRIDWAWRDPSTLWAWLAWLLMLITAGYIQRSRLVLTAERLEQSWMWRKEMGLQDLLLVQILRVPGLDWLIAPRVYVRNMTGKFAFFYCSDPALLSELQRLSQTLVQSRRL